MNRRPGRPFAEDKEPRLKKLTYRFDERELKRAGKNSRKLYGNVNTNRFIREAIAEKNDRVENG